MKTLKAGRHIICSSNDARVLADIDVSDDFLSVELGYINGRGGFQFYGHKEWDQFVEFIGELDEKMKGLDK